MGLGRVKTSFREAGEKAGPVGCDALPDQNPPKSSRRDGPHGPGLQSDPGYEHRWGQAVDGRDRGLTPNRSGFLPGFPEWSFYTAKTQSRQNTKGSNPVADPKRCWRRIRRRASKLTKVWGRLLFDYVAATRAASP
jgi:hypothetical protein